MDTEQKIKKPDGRHRIRSSEEARRLQAMAAVAQRAKGRADYAAARIMKVALASPLTEAEKAARAGELCALYGVNSDKATHIVVVLLSALDKAINRGDPESVKLVLGLVGQQASTAQETETAAAVPVLIPGGVVPSAVVAQARALEQAATGGTHSKEGGGGGKD